MTPPIEWIEIRNSKKAESVVSKLDVEEKEFLLKALESEKKQEGKESKETATKSLEFEKDTFKIDSTWWEQEKRVIFNRWEEDVKVNPEWDVIEHEGEQIFLTYDAVIREVMKSKNCSKEEVEKKYLMNFDEFLEKMEDKPSGSEEYMKFFNEECKDHLAGGYWSTSDGRKWIMNHRETFNMWLTRGCDATFAYGKWYAHYNWKKDGHSVRLLKN